MKSSQSCSSSSSSSEILSPTIKMVKPKVKRARRSKNPVKCQNVESPGRRSSMFRGVTRHRWTGRFEAHLWDKNTWNQVQNKKGRQVYLGAYDEEEAAAHTYDLAALKYWGADTFLNFPFDTYTKEFEEMQNVSKEEYLATLRRRSSGFSRGVSKYRGVARHHHNGRWEARIGRVFGNKYLYLGTYGTQEEAATAYDLAAIEYRGTNAVTNFDISHYLKYPQPHPSLQHQQLLQALQLQHYQQKQQQEEEASPFIESHEMTPSISESQMPTPELPSSDDPLTVVVDHIEEEHPWSICMDSEFNPLPVLDIAIGKSNELLDLFEDTQFEENIDLFFGGGSKEYGINLDNVFENSGGFEGSFLGGAIEEHGDESYPYPISICS